jgi:hypothetical protein
MVLTWHVAKLRDLHVTFNVLPLSLSLSLSLLGCFSQVFVMVFGYLLLNIATFW